MPKIKYRKTLQYARPALLLLLGALTTFGQQQINLTAGPTTISLPDGASVPMWGYSCGAAAPSSTASCARLNPSGSGWSPVVITVPSSASGGLQINLTNNLTFSGNALPTSLTIVGLVGGGLGTPGASDASPTHAAAQTITWPASDSGTFGTPPTQGPRVR